MNFKRIGMSIVSLVLVCCLLVNVSPIKAEAIAIESAVAIGCAAVLSLAACGVIFHPQTQKDIEAIGNAFSTYLYQWDTSAEKLTEVDEFVGGLTLYDGSGDDDDDGYDQMWKYAKGGIWGGIAAFIVGAILDNKIDVENPNNEAVWVTSFTIKSIYGSESVYTCDDGFGVLKFNVTGRTYDYYVFYCDSNSTLLCDGGECTNDTFEAYRYATASFSPDVWYSSDPSWYLGERTSASYSSALAYALGIPETVPISPYYVGDIPEKIQNNEYDLETLPLPETIYYGNIIDPDLGAVQSVINLADDLATGKITFEEYITYITPPETDPTPEVTAPTEIEIPEPTIDSDTLADANPNTFLEQLGAYITSPFRWIWSNIKTYFEPLTRPELWTETIPEIAFAPARWIWEKIQTEFAPFLDPDTLARPLPEIIAAPFQNLWNNLQNAFDSLRQTADNAAQKVVDGLKEATVPDKDYLSDKVNALLAEYAFADSIVNTAKSIKMGLAGVTTEPPVIYIHLEDNRGSYDWGGAVPFLDLRWYAEYKPTVDALISAFLWICFAWKMLLKLPGIISGMPGDFVMDSVHHIGMSEHMPVRKAEYEVQRASNRQYIRKGKDG